MPAICVDIDNVVARTDEVMREVIRDYSSGRVDLGYDDVVCFDYWMCRDRYGRRFEGSEWPNIHEEFSRNHLFRIAPYDNIKNYLQQIAERFEVHLATSRLAEGREATIQWLSQHEIPYGELHFVAHGEKHLIGQQFVGVVEDDREQGYAFSARGVRVFLLAHPWNHVGSYSALRRLGSWEEINREIVNLEM